MGPTVVKKVLHSSAIDQDQLTAEIIQDGQ